MGIQAGFHGGKGGFQGTRDIAGRHEAALPSKWLQESLTAGFAEGIADALVGGACLAVDAVGVDLEQDGDAVAGAARDFGGGDPGVEP
jgi:hypothetical protein